MMNKPITTHPFLFDLNSPEEDRKAEPVILKMKDTTIHTLKELRENYSPDELLKYHLEGDLVRWLNQHYYEKEAADIFSIKFEDKNCLEQICSALDIPFQIELSPEEEAALSEKRELLRKYTDDEAILANPQNVAMNQEDLATLLNKHCKKIYLCAEDFSIPISVADVEYICLANATLNNPYTEQQYLRAGIKLQGFSLPVEENPDNAVSAMNAALSNGYDDFSDNHSDLTAAFHHMFQCTKYTQYYHIPFNSSLASKFFNSRYECENSVKEEIRKAYDKAGKYISVGNSSCIAKECAKVYAKHLENETAPYMNLLEKAALMTSSADSYDKIKEQISKSYKLLLARFEAELTDNSDYYQMYDFDYFVNQIDIEEHDYRISDNDALRLIERFVSGSIQYTISDLYSPVSEIEEDLNEHCATFFNTALTEYQDFVSEIENLIDLIGRNLPSMTEDESLTDYLTRSCIKISHFN